MAVEYVIVRFPQRRAVFVDDYESGVTDKKFRVGPGTHTINLGEPRDYTPKWRRPTVVHTTPLRPMEIVFEEL